MRESLVHCILCSSSSLCNPSRPSAEVASATDLHLLQAWVLVPYQLLKVLQAWSGTW